MNGPGAGGGDAGAYTGLSGLGAMRRQACIEYARGRDLVSQMQRLRLPISRDHTDAPLTGPNFNGMVGHQDDCLGNRLFVVLAFNKVGWREDAPFSIDLKYTIVSHVQLRV
jgi:hypothetical protein